MGIAMPPEKTIILVIIKIIIQSVGRSRKNSRWDGYECNNPRW